MNGTVKDVDQRNFEGVLKGSDRLVVVEFYLTTCPSCAAIAPVYEALSQELKENATFTRVEARQNMPLSVQYGVKATPTFKFFCKGQPIGELVGGVNETLLRNTIKDLIRHRSECVSRSTRLVYEIDGYA